MILKIKDEAQMLITVIQVAMFEHNYKINELKIWDVADNTAMVTPKYAFDLDRVVRDLCSRNYAEIDGEIEWE